MKNIACNPCVLRQTADSRFSYFAGSFDELVDLVEQYFFLAKNISGDGLRKKVTLPVEECGRFFSGVCLLDEHSILETVFASRFPGEMPYKQTVVVDGEKTRAKFVDIILYHVSALKPHEKEHWPEGPTGPKVVVDNEWQIISINARSTEDEEPPTPEALARNDASRLGLPEGQGGTPAAPTADDYRRSILYWSGRAMSKGK